MDVAKHLDRAPHRSRLVSFVARFLASDAADDLVEYAILTASIGCVGAAAFSFFSQAINGTYSSWNVGQQNLWEPPNPQ